MRKKYFYFLIFIIFTNFIYAQKPQIGFTVSLLSNNEVTRFGGSYLDDASYTAGKSITYGLTFIKPINNWLDMETGFEYLKGEASVSSIIPGYFAYSHQGSASLMNIPIGLRANFLKYCFVNGGIVFDIDVSSNSPIQSQTGIGSLLGVGLKYDFSSGISIFVNPYFKMHALISPTSNNNQHLLESATRFGITYHL